MDQAGIYIQEATQHIEYAKMCFSEYRQARADENIPMVFFHVHHFVVHVANVDRILDPKLGSRRAQVLKDSIDLTGIDLKPLRRLRNHLEHFDERLDKWLAKFEGHAFLDMNLVDGTKDFPEEAFLRAMDGDIFKFHGESYDLPELPSQLTDIEERIPTWSIH